LYIFLYIFVEYSVNICIKMQQFKQITSLIAGSTSIGVRNNNIGKVTRFNRFFSTSKPSLNDEEMSASSAVPIKVNSSGFKSIESEHSNSSTEGNMSITPQASVSQVTWNVQGAKRLLSKTPELYWRDLQENRQELSWYLTESLQSQNNSNINNSSSLWSTSSSTSTNADTSSLKWYTDWKSNYSKKPPVSAQAHQFDAQASGSSNSYSYSLSEIKLNTPKSTLKSHRTILQELGIKLGVRSLDDWYYVNIVDVEDKDIRLMLTANYNSSLIQALVANFPECDWKIYKFDNSYRGILNDELDRTAIDQQIEEQNGNPKSEDFNTTVGKFKDHWQVRLFHNKPNPVFGINRSRTTPNDMHKSTMEKLPLSSQETQHLFKVVKNLFPNSNAEVSYYDPKLIYSDTRRPFSLSVYVPEHKLGFDYFDDPNTPGQYSVGANYNFNFFNRSKKLVCDKVGITLIDVPSWWDKKSDSVLAAIKRCRPELFKK